MKKSRLGQRSFSLLAMLCALARSGQAAPLVFNGDFAKPLAGTWSAGGKSRIEPSVVTAQIEAEKSIQHALRLELKAAEGANPWDVWLKAPDTTSAIAKSDMIGVQFWAKSTNPTRFNAIYQQGAPNFAKTIRQTVSLGPQWQKFAFFAPAQVAQDAGASNFEFQLGQTSGTVEVAGVRVENLGAVSLAEAQKLFAVAPVAVAPVAVAPVAAAVVAPMPPVKLRPRKAPPYVVLKLDDLVKTGKGEVPPRWKKLADFIRERKIKAGIGIICDSLEGESPKYFDWIKEQQAIGLFEFWDHGYSHKEWEANGQKIWEFKGTSAEEQKDHLMRSQTLAREKLGFSLPTFSAGFNAIDENTAKALQGVSEVKVWMYGDPKLPAGKVVLERPPWLGIENPLFVPSLERFVRPYSNLAEQQCLVIQGHPNQWDEVRFAEFVRIVDFLTEQKAVFVTPSEAAALNNTPAP
jgi:peptidoglycan/xylan/chitin deacetylase (PgdA/CDA1 family)